MLHLLLYVAKVLSSPKPWEADDSNRVSYPCKTNLTHMHGTQSPTRLFPFLSSLWIRVPPSFNYSEPTCCAYPKPNSIRYLSFPNHISRHMVSTFKSLTTTTTHCDLSIFLPWTTSHDRASTLYFAVCSRKSEPIISRAAENHSTFIDPN